MPLFPRMKRGSGFLGLNGWLNSDSERTYATHGSVRLKRANPILRDDQC